LFRHEHAKKKFLELRELRLCSRVLDTTSLDRQSLELLDLFLDLLGIAREGDGFKQLQEVVVDRFELMREGVDPRNGEAEVRSNS
jgi:hypothetical protein